MSPIGKRFKKVIESREDFPGWDVVLEAINEPASEFEKFLVFPNLKGMWRYRNYLHMTDEEIGAVFAPPATEEEKLAFLKNKPKA